MFCCPFLVIFDYSFVGEIATVPHIVGFVVFSTYIEFHWSMIMPFNLPFKAIKKPKYHGILLFAREGGGCQFI